MLFLEERRRARSANSDRGDGGGGNRKFETTVIPPKRALSLAISVGRSKPQRQPHKKNLKTFGAKVEQFFRRYFELWKIRGKSGKIGFRARIIFKRAQSAAG